jgi:hypothetical protein
MIMKGFNMATKKNTRFKCDHCGEKDLTIFIEVRVFHSYWDGQEQYEYYGGEYWCLDCVRKAEGI